MPLVSQYDAQFAQVNIPARHDAHDLPAASLAAQRRRDWGRAGALGE